MTLRLILPAAGLRALVIGYCGVGLGLYAGAQGWGPGRLGVLVGLGLLGNAVATGLVAMAGDQFGRKRALLLSGGLSVFGLAMLGLSTDFAVMAPAMLLGMVNGMGRDRGAALTVEQSILADAVTSERRTALFVRYTLVQDLAGAMGSLAVALPAILARALVVQPAQAHQLMFAAAALAMAAQTALHAGLASDAPAHQRPAPGAMSPESRRRVSSLSALFALDSLGGGLLAGSILSYWFFKRFDMGAGAVGAVFFAARLLNAASYFGAEWLARRIGLVRTMVFTHLPTSLILALLPLIPSAPAVVSLFLLREALVQMDVPARQSYVAAVVEPSERTAALGLTNLARYMGWAAGPPLAGLAMNAFGLGAPLLLGAGLKASYDVWLFAAFRSVRAPEEAKAD